MDMARCTGLRDLVSSPVSSVVEDVFRAGLAWRKRNGFDKSSGARLVARLRLRGLPVRFIDNLCGVMPVPVYTVQQATLTHFRPPLGGGG